MRTWMLTHPARPSTINQARTWHYHTRAQHDDQWRLTFWYLAADAEIPPLDAIEITVGHERINGSGLPDVGSPMFSVKAAIDGLAGVPKPGKLPTGAQIIPDDGPRYVRRLTFLPAEVTGRDALTLTIEEVV